MTHAVARSVFAEMNGKGTVCMIDGNPLGILYEDRAGGFRDGLKDYPDIRLLGARDGEFLRKPAESALHALIEEHGVPDAVLAANDFSALGVIDALRQHGARALVGSVNATPDGVQAIKAGDMHASAAFNAMHMGCLAVEAALRRYAGETIPDKVLLPAEIVTRQNLALWDLGYEERPLPDWDTIVHDPKA